MESDTEQSFVEIRRVYKASNTALNYKLPIVTHINTILRTYVEETVRRHSGLNPYNSSLTIHFLFLNLKKHQIYNISIVKWRMDDKIHKKKIERK